MSDGKQAKGLWQRLSGHLRLWPMLLCLLAGVLLLALGGEGRAETKTAEDSTLRTAEHALAEELTTLCSAVEGVGDCRVKVTLLSGERTVYEGGRAVAVLAPEVQAVTVVCEGARSERVRGMLLELLSAHLSVGTHRISILPLKK